MAKASAGDTLESFHDGSVLTIAGLQRWLLRSARDPGCVLALLEESHERWLGAVKSSCSEFAASHGNDFPRAFRNLVASVLADDLDFWRHALDQGAFDVFGARDSLDRVLRVAEERAPAKRKRILPALEALSQASKCDIAALAPLVASLWPVAFALSRQLPAAKVPQHLLRVIRAEGSQSDGAAKRMAQALQQIVAERPRAAFDLETFERVPKELLARIPDPHCLLRRSEAARLARREARQKRDAERRRALIARQTADALQAIDDLVASDEERRTKAWPALRRSLAALERRLDAVSRNAFVRGICDRLLAQSAQWKAIPPAPAATLRAIRALPFGGASSLLGFLGTVRRRQCRMSLSDAVGSDAYGRLNSVDRVFESALLAAAVAEYLRSRSERPAIWKSWGVASAGYASQKLRVDAWRPVFLANRKLAAEESLAALQWMMHATDGDRQQFAQLHSKWLMSRVTDRVFVKQVVDTQQRSTAAMLLGGICVRRFMAASTAMGFTASTDKKAAIGTTLTNLIDARFASPAGETCIADRLVADGPSRLGLVRTIDLLGFRLDEKQLSTIIDGTAGKPLTGAVVSKLLDRAQRERSGALALALNSLIRGDRLRAELGPVIWRRSLKRSRKDALELLGHAPQRFATLAAATLPADELLISAVVSPAIAHHVGGKIKPAALRAALPEVRRRLAGNPRMLAIAELAALSDPIEIPHLTEIQRAVSMGWELDPGTRLDRRYRTYQIPKRSGGNRTITVPDDSLKRLQRRLLAGAFELVPLHDAAHGFRKGRSIVSNASRHVAKRLVVNVDISRFFPSTLHASVLAACMKVDGGRITAQTALLLAEICCYEGALPTGAPTSPAIGNIVLRRADRAIAKAAKASRISYTRYADDLTFSGNSNAKQILPFVKKVLGECGYEIDKKKTQLYRRGRQQLVTNLVVNHKANLRRSDRRRLRAAVNHRCVGKPVVWHGRPMADAELRGRLALLAMVNRDEARAHMRRLSAQAPEWVKRDG
jgi:hypothetical protein